MLRTYLYIPDELEKKVIQTAKLRDKSKAEVIRQALEIGMAAIQQDDNSSAEVLLKIAETGKKFKLSGPKDSSQRIDELLWGIKRNDE